MEPIFVNRHTRTEDVYREYLFYYYFKRFGAILFLVLSSFIFIYGILNFVSNPTPAAICILIPVLYFAFMIRSYTVSKKAFFLRDLELNGGKPMKTEHFVTDTAIATFSPSTQARYIISLQKIKSVGKTENLYLLYSKAGSLFIFQKNGFVKGAPEEFEAFFRARGFKF